MPTVTPSRSTVSWGQGTHAQNVNVRRLADTPDDRKQLEQEATKDQVPSAVVKMGNDVLLLSGRELVTQSRIARTLGPVIKDGGTLSVDGANASVLYTDDGFREIDAKDVTVAVIDTGLDVNHPAFQGRIVKPYNVLTGTTDVTDKNGHGTHCAGIIAGSWGINPDAGGVAPQVKIMPIKAGDGTFTSQALSDALRHAADTGAKVISMSIGGRSSMPDVQDALKYALSKGCVVCIAAGNDGKYSVSFPAAYPEAISVGSSKDGKRSSFSNGGDRLDVSAPGENILSSVPGGKYAQMSGTSMATPYVAGEVALVMAEHPDWTPQQVQEQIKRGVNDLGAAGWDRDFGYGEVNLFKAVYGDNLPAVPRVPQKPKSFWQKLLAFFGLDV